MSQSKKKNVFVVILDFFYNIFVGKKYDIKNVRRVYFGLRFRLITLTGIALLIILSITVFIFLNLQKKAIMDEKLNKTAALAKTLGVIFESYIDNDIKTGSAERNEKMASIRNNCNYFLSFNDDIYKIFVTNEKGVIIYSTYHGDIKKVTNASYVHKTLKEKKIVDDYIFKIDKERYCAVSYPVFISKGNITDVLSDFDKYYDKYYSSSKTGKQRIINSIKYKYKEQLGQAFYRDNEKDVVSKQQDIDFIFLRLFSEIMKNRQRNYKKGEAYLWNEGWLHNEKIKIVRAKNEDLLETALTSQNKIRDTLKYLKLQIEDIKLLGAVAILSDLNSLSKKAGKNLNLFVIIFLIMSVIALFLISFLIMQTVKNLKTLQNGAQKFGIGDLDSKIMIKTNDETGRLADILNNMAVDIQEKLHMEKFVSKSTISMIKKSNSHGYNIKPGTVQKVFLSFIFADVRGFTSFSEANTPEVVLDTLNIYFQLQHDIIKKYNGDVDDFVGDQIMAHFSGRDSEEASCNAAVEIMKGIRDLNKKRKAKGLPYFEVGAGVHSGVVVTGNIGSRTRMDFACVGDAVNTTSRLCSKAEPGEILISDSHAKAVSRLFKFAEHLPVELKGKKEKLKVYKLFTGL